MPKYNGPLDDDFEPDDDYTNFQKIQRKPKKLDEDKVTKKQTNTKQTEK